MDTYIYAGNMPFDVTEDMLRELFGTVGKVEEVKLALNTEEGPMKGLFMGYAFVKMSNPDDVLRAIKELEGHDLGGREIHLEPGANNTDLWERAFK